MSRELLYSVGKKDLEISYFSGTGAGGQHRNRHMNCVRIKHPASGALVTGQSNKERLSNVREALTNLVNNPKYKIWSTIKANEIRNKKTITQLVNEQMDPENIKIEGKNATGQWEEIRDPKDKSSEKIR